MSQKENEEKKQKHAREKKIILFEVTQVDIDTKYQKQERKKCCREPVVFKANRQHIEEFTENNQNLIDK